MDDKQAREHAERLILWVNKATDACEASGRDAVAPLLDELSPLDLCIVVASLITQRVEDKQRLTQYLAGLN